MIGLGQPLCVMIGLGQPLCVLAGLGAATHDFLYQTKKKSAKIQTWRQHYTNTQTGINQTEE
jgi:hypothetical protein